MMSNYNNSLDSLTALAAGKRRIRLEGKIIMDDIVSLGIVGFTKDFYEHMNAGRLLALNSSAAAAYLDTAHRELQVGRAAPCGPKPPVVKTADIRRRELRRARDARYRNKRRQRSA